MDITNPRRVARRVVATAVFALTVLTGVGALAAPASAHHADTHSASITIDGGLTNLWARRSGWGADFGVGLADTKADGDCVHVDAKVVVDNGPDPSGRILSVCGAGQSAQRIARIAIGSQGLRVTGVEVTLCRNRNNLPDVCSSRSFAIPDMTQHATWTRINEANAVMQTTLGRFRQLDAARYGGFDWSDDGCSVPSGIPGTATWSARFDTACDRHDFGYRNYGKGLMHPTDGRRQWVDEVFYWDMISLCRTNGWTGCDAAALAFYGAVRNQGGRAFFGY